MEHKNPDDLDAVHDDLPVPEAAIEAPPNALLGVFKKIEFATFQLTCTRCAKVSNKTIPTDIVSYVACRSCGLVHTANPSVKENNIQPN